MSDKHGRNDSMSHEGSELDQEETQQMFMLSLARRRLYRFSSSDAAHVLVEELENKLLSQHPVSPETLYTLKQYLEDLAHDVKTPLDIASIADREGINVPQGIEQRTLFDATASTGRSPEKAIFIIGSPRSGTTYLYNLLAFQNTFAYLTNISHHRWPLYNFHHLNGRKHVQRLGASVLQEDSKHMRLLSDVIIPDEAEHVFERAVPAYTTLRTHQYILNRPELHHPDLLREVASKHVEAFESPFFFSKSPFNTFRIQALQQIFGTSTYFIHIHRNGYATSASMKAHGFKYFLPDDPTDDPDLFWERHIQEILEHRGKVPMIEIAFESLLANPVTTLHSIFSWLHLDYTPQTFDRRYTKENRTKRGERRESIEQYNAELGYE